MSSLPLSTRLNKLHLTTTDEIPQTQPRASHSNESEFESWWTSTKAVIVIKYYEIFDNALTPMPPPTPPSDNNWPCIVLLHTHGHGSYSQKSTWHVCVLINICLTVPMWVSLLNIWLCSYRHILTHSPRWLGTLHQYCLWFDHMILQACIKYYEHILLTTNYPSACIMIFSLPFSFSGIGTHSWAWICVLCYLMTPGRSKDIRCHVWPMHWPCSVLC